MQMAKSIIYILLIGLCSDHPLGSSINGHITMLSKLIIVFNVEQQLLIVFSVGQQYNLIGNVNHQSIIVLQCLNCQSSIYYCVVMFINNL